MKMLAFFFKYSRNIMWLSVAAGIASGACNAVLLAVINKVVKTNGSTVMLLWGFANLCILLPVARFSSEFLLNRLGQAAMYSLRLQLCRQILAAPLRHLEQIGAPRLLAALTDDVPTITSAILIFPLLCVNTSVAIGCLVYMGVLSPLLLAIVLGFMVLGVITYQLPIIKVQKLFALARKDADALQGHFRALTQGTKELKIHGDRRQAFLSEGLEKTAGSLQQHNREGETETFALGPIDLSFHPGELVFIVGGNGSGKTTLVKLLTGLYMPEQGHIVLDGEPIGNANKEFYRRHFSTVFSDFYLFDQLLGIVNPQLDSQAQEYLAQLKLLHKVQIVDGKLSTTDPSQGQRKRLALLTAYLEDRLIYVFDEWPADQDPHFKAVFYLQLLPELKAKGKTVFVISHDDRYYHIADRLIKLEEGQVVSDISSTAGPAVQQAAANGSDSFVLVPKTEVV